MFEPLPNALASFMIGLAFRVSKPIYVCQSGLLSAEKGPVLNPISIGLLFIGKRGFKLLLRLSRINTSGACPSAMEECPLQFDFRRCRDKGSVGADFSRSCAEVFQRLA